MVPTAALPPDIPSTDQLTVVFTAPVTELLNPWVRPVVTLAVAGATAASTGAVMVTVAEPVTRSPAELVMVKVYTWEATRGPT